MNISYQVEPVRNPRVQIFITRSYSPLIHILRLVTLIKLFRKLFGIKRRGFCLNPIALTKDSYWPIKCNSVTDLYVRTLYNV